jgi:hypothetical protein
MSVEDVSLPNLSREFPLDANQVSLFRRDGHILLRGVATPEEVAASELNPLAWNAEEPPINS